MFYVLTSKTVLLVCLNNLYSLHFKHWDHVLWIWKICVRFIHWHYVTKHNMKWKPVPNKPLQCQDLVREPKQEQDFKNHCLTLSLTWKWIFCRTSSFRISMDRVLAEKKSQAAESISVFTRPAIQRIYFTLVWRMQTYEYGTCHGFTIKKENTS